MKLVAKLKLQPLPEQGALMLATMERMNAACDWISEQAFIGKHTTYDSIRESVYYTAREKFGLSSQMACLACKKVAIAYKRDPFKRPKFRSRGAVPFDQRNMTLKQDQIVSIITLEGREEMPYLAGDYQRLQLLGKYGQSELIYRNGEWFLHVTVETFEQEPSTPTEWLGVDLGIVNLATDSDGNIYSGAGVEAVRVRRLKLRSDLQKCGTRSAKKHLKKDSKREANFRSDVNHCISKKLVAHAQGTCRGIKLEDLSGIREGTTVRREQRARFGGWGFAQLRFDITYKALLAGVPVEVVDPRNTSRTCPKCGHVAKANRKSQAKFVCTSKSCDFVGHADIVGATNISRKAPVNEPIVSGNDRGKRKTRESCNGTSRSSGASTALHVRGC